MRQKKCITKERLKTRILAVVVEVRERERTGPRQTRNLGNRRPRPNENREIKSHWARDCPKKKGRTPKVLALKEDD